MNKIRAFFSRFIRPKYGWFGNYSSWEEALADSTGYDNEEIFKKVFDAALKVKNGEAAYERDSVLFYEPEYNWLLLTYIFNTAVRKNGQLNIVDFGGSLGSSYFQHIKYLKNLPDFTWSVIEQHSLVTIGKKYFADQSLGFYYDINEVNNSPDIILLNCVLPYLSQPYEILFKICSLKPQYILVLDTPLLNNESLSEIISLHKVDTTIYNATIPTIFLHQKKVISYLKSQGYDLDYLKSTEIKIKYKNYIIPYISLIFKLNAC